MKKGVLFLFIFLLLLVITLNVYWIVPPHEIEFGAVFEKGNSEFSLDNQTDSMLFYENMRFPYKEISYSIDEECSIKKRADMIEAFNIIENLTVLEFYPKNDGEIKISCQEKNIVEEGMFIAGEGGPTKIIESGKYHIIYGGHILLIRDSSCSLPNIAIHELLHVLGFNHSENRRNIMYPYSRCTQVIGEEIPEKINKLYLEESLPDLTFEEINASVKSGFLDFNLTIRNIGIIESNKSILKIYVDGKEVKEYNVASLEAGTGIKLSATNIFLKRLKAESLEFEIVNEFDELNKENNKKELKEKEN